MMSTEEVYLELLKEWRCHVRNHETQRNSVASFHFLIASGTLAFIAYLNDSPSHPDRWYVIGGVVFLALVGLLTTLVLLRIGERCQYALEVSREIEAAIDKLMRYSARDYIPIQLMMNNAEVTLYGIGAKRDRGLAQKVRRVCNRLGRSLKLQFIYPFFPVASILLCATFLIFLCVHRHPNASAAPPDPLAHRVEQSNCPTTPAPTAVQAVPRSRPLKPVPKVRP